MKHLSYTFLGFLSPLTPSPPALCISPSLLPFLTPFLASPLPTPLLHPLLIHYFHTRLFSFSHPCIYEGFRTSAFKNKNQEYCSIKRARTVRKDFSNLKPPWERGGEKISPSEFSCLSRGPGGGSLSGQISYSGGVTDGVPRALTP